MDEWKSENIYPYLGEATTPVEQAERKVFDIIAVSVHEYPPDFPTTPAETRALHLQMLRIRHRAEPRH